MTADTRTRVAFCIDQFGVGGSELNALRTAEALDPRRIALQVFHFAADGPLLARYRALGVPMTHMPISSFASLRTTRQGWRFSQALRAWKTEVLHTHCVYSNIFAVPWGWLSGCPTIASRRWWHFSPGRGLHIANRLTYRLAHRVLANTEAVAAMLRDEERVPEKKIVTIHNFLDDGAFAPVDPELIAGQRAAWGVPAGALVLGIVARLHPVKNHQLLMQALAQTAPNVHLVAIGDGPSRATLEEQARALGIAARVHFAGELVMANNPHRYFDVSVLSSTSEGFPNTVIEGMAAARPVVATPVGGVLDVIEHDKTGLLAPLGDPTAMGAAFTRLQNDSALRARIGAAAQALVAARYRRERVIENLSTLYESLARRN